jgi:4-hydroxy-tetrahydrodipicolinate reductase
VALFQSIILFFLSKGSTSIPIYQLLFGVFSHFFRYITETNYLPETPPQGVTMTIKVLVNGAFGRMGQMTVNAIKSHPRLELVGQTGREYDLYKSIKDSQAQVVVDFTHPKSILDNLTTIIKAGTHPVIGTTGLTIEQIKQFQETCKNLKLGGIIAPNFSMGAVLMMKYAKEIIKYMPNAEIIEMHHDNKADSPSGTAIRTAELMASSNTAINQPDKASHETIPHARGAKLHDIPIHAIRLPGLLAHEQIIFGGTGETLTLRHDSIDRECFMPGVCFACEKVIKLDQLIYGLEEVL